MLNTWRVWNDRVEDDAVGTVTRLKKALGDIADTHTDVDTGLVDYDAMEGDERFAVFEEGVCELQAVRIEEADVDSRLAFFINLYNMMIYHAFTKLGRPESTFRRSSFFAHVSYNIGGRVYSFHDIESGTGAVARA